ncbi:Protein of unknown function [Solitalea koreensis]|uniref:DUF4783 domain-containing protein n=1 Tax=Solitalea koreensis TaxID=543615 RepID=A0A521DZA7_9SPHI|nr:Protein of unknown function [Solitalea koreensis]
MVLFLLCTSMKSTYKQSDAVEVVTAAISVSNTREISKYLNSIVILAILDEENVYSKTQGEMVLKDFFSKYPPVQVLLKHTGSSPEGLKYAICSYRTTNNAMYRLYIYMKSTGKVHYINELRFEREK